MQVEVRRHRNRSRHIGLWLAIIVGLPAAVFAQQLPIKTYTVLTATALRLIGRNTDWGPRLSTIWLRREWSVGGAV